MAQTTGTPALNPPPPGDPQSLADTPQSVDRYDCVIGGTGFMLYRDQDDTHPSETYSPQPVDLTYTPVFIERQNVQGDLGDNTQDFYMTFVQRDWSGGIGQKYFRQQQDRERSFWDGANLRPTVAPGSVTIGPREQTQALINGSDRWCNMLYIKETGSNTASQGDAMFKVEGISGTTVKFYGSRDGGQTWSLQPVSAASPWSDCCDLVAGDNGTIYCLEATGGAGSQVHTFPGLTLGVAGAGTATTVTITNWTAFSFGANCIEFYNGQVYVGGGDATIRQMTSAGGAGTTIKDLGGGKIVDLLSAGGLLWVFYISAQGDYRLYNYDGSTIQEAARLPRGWKMQYSTETPLRQFDLLDTNPNATHPRQVQAMCFQDGVVYISGMTPTADWAQGQRGACPFRTALWYYSKGNTGLIWEADVTQQHYYWGGGSACCPIYGGQIAFADVLNNKLMCYDPNTGGVFPLATLSNPPAGGASLGVQLASGTSTTSLVTTVHVADFNGMPTPGTVLQRTAGGTVQELMLVTSENGIGPADLTLVRGYAGTTPDDASLAGMTTGTTKTCTFTLPVPPVYRLEYDWQNHVLHAVWTKDDPDKLYGGAGVFTSFQNQHTFWAMRDPKSNDTGVIATSNFDFNSSLQKFFRSVSVDFEADQMNRTDSRNGTVDIWYKVDGVVSTTADSGTHLVKSNAATGTQYDILTQGASIQILVVLNSGATSSTQQQSMGPNVKRISVKGAPIMPGYRMRKYVLALFDNVRLKDGGQEQGTPASLRKALEALIQSNVPVSVSDAAMSGVTMVFEPDQCKLREVRPGEYLCYVVLREV